MRAALILLLFLPIMSACSDRQSQPDVTVNPGGLARLLEHDAATAETRFREAMSTSVPDSVDEQGFVILGYELLGQGRAEHGAVVFRLLTELRPDSWNAWDSLGEAFLYLGDGEAATAAYQRSLELNPENMGARMKLDGMDRELYEFGHETTTVFAHEAGARTGLHGPYLGQEPPGLEPRVFAPGLISTRGGFEFSCSFSPDGRHLYFNRGFEISECRLEDDGWTAPQLVAFSNGRLHHEAHVTHDGQRLFFGGVRASEPGAEPGYAIWVCEREGDGWSEPRRHGPGMYVTTARNGNLYLTDIQGVVGGGLAMQRWLGHGYGELERLPDHLNSHPAAHPCIAPDESWLIFDATRPDALGGEGDDDFYISFRQGDQWSEPVHLTMGISDRGANMCASVTPDGRYLFFHGKRDIHWVSTEVLERFRPAD